MNLQLSNTEEYLNDKLTGELGQVLIRWVLLLPWMATLHLSTYMFMGSNELG